MGQGVSGEEETEVHTGGEQQGSDMIVVVYKKDAKEMNEE